MSQSKTILFFGNERLATGVETNTPVLKALVSKGYNVAAIITGPDQNLASRKQRTLEVADFARTHNIPLIESARLRERIDELRGYGAIAGVLAAFGRMVPQEVIDIFPRGIINIHPSLLPLHRGPTPIESTILSGSNKTGVSLMALAAAMDSGPIFDQITISLNGTESKQELANTLGQIGAERLVDLLPKILDGKLSPSPQIGSATYDKRLESPQGELDYNLPAKVLERQIRAFLGWPRSKTIIQGLPVVVTEGHALDSETSTIGQFKTIDKQLVVTTKEGLLVIDRLIPSSGKEMTGADFLLGHPIA